MASWRTSYSLEAFTIMMLCSFVTASLPFPCYANMPGRRITVNATHLSVLCDKQVTQTTNLRGVSQAPAGCSAVWHHYSQLPNSNFHHRRSRHF
ncbi:hypothetical protein BDY21DRAFT_54266 [Lineolata rhizophorae]|uniref:Uncharacterized protein n=1 Tax=Lineolata rhizophorae TaxID=578093 RepID=A0A6A6NY02_9PEZI|nr:hypothetical protein BDY21DRAFT_54266 [Lineolata rhizophorae]